MSGRLLSTDIIDHQKQSRYKLCLDAMQTPNFQRIKSSFKSEVVFRGRVANVSRPTKQQRQPQMYKTCVA